MQKRDFLKAGLLAPIAASLPAKTPAKPMPQGKRLNVLILTVDDMDLSLMGYMGNKHGLTPNLDKLAARSHIFANNRGASPICMPSRQAFLSGLIPHRNGPGGFDPMYEGTPSLCTILGKAGWHTAASHKIEHMQPESSFPWDEQVDGHDRNILVHAAEFKHAAGAAKVAGRPFFIICNINDPHRPFYGTQGAAKMDHDDKGPYGIARPVGPADVDVPPFLPDIPGVRKDLSQYWNSVQRADVAIGQVLQAFDESGEANNTVVVFCNDHGMPFPYSKCSGYDQGTKVPALVSYPGMSKPQRFENLACNIDIMPTVLDLVGLPIPAGIDGRSWLPRMRGEKVAEPEFIVTYVNGVASGHLYPVRTIQDHRYSLIYQTWSDGQFKLSVDSSHNLSMTAMQESSDPKLNKRAKDFIMGVPVSFFDRETDPGQWNNLIDHPHYKPQIERMQKALLAEMERTKDPQLANVRTMMAGGKAVVKQPAHPHGIGEGGADMRDGAGKLKIRSAT